LYAAALLSKVSAAGLIWLLVLSDIFVLHRLPVQWSSWGDREYRKVWLEKVPFLVAAAAAAAVGWLGMLAGGYFSQSYTLVQRLLLFTYGATFYIEKTLVPWALSPLYPLPLHWRAMGVEFALRTAFLAAGTLWLLRRRAKDPFPAFAWLACLLIFLPVSGIAQCARHIAADRYAALCCLPAVWAAARKLHWQRRFWPVAAAAIVILMGLTWRQCGYWKNDRLLWSRAIFVDPQNQTARYNLGTLLMPTDRGAALEEFLAVLKLDPEDADAQFNAASLYGRTAEAVPHYREALRLHPLWIQALNNLALVQITLKNYPEAMNLLNRALAIDDHFAEGRFNRGALFMMEGRRAAGQADLSRAVREKPELGLRLGKDQRRLLTTL
jgi:tetratricopeptide (TPR) repeat protein